MTIQQIINSLLSAYVIAGDWENLRTLLVNGFIADTAVDLVTLAADNLEGDARIAVLAVLIQNYNVDQI